MATRDDLQQLESQLSLAYDSNDTFKVCSLLDELSTSYANLGFKGMAEMNFGQAAVDFDSAVRATTSFQKQYQEIVGDKLLDHAPEKLVSLEQLLEDVRLNQKPFEAFSYYCTAFFNNYNRNPGIAVSYFEKAEEAFADLTEVKEYDVAAKYCNALKFFAEGFEEFYRTNFANARIAFQRSKIAFEKLLAEDLNDVESGQTNTNQVRIMKGDYLTVKALYFNCEARYQFGIRNFKNAYKAFSNAVVAAEEAKNNNAELNNTILKQVTTGDYHLYTGWKLLAEAEVLREAEQWEKAFDNYELVKKEWEQASGAYVSSGHPSGVMLQETVLNQSLTIDIYQAVCENERELKNELHTLQEEITSLKDNLFAVIKPAGVTINNTQEVLTTVEQNVQFVQKIENNVRKEIQELLETLKTLAIEDATKHKLVAKATEVVQSKEQGPKFLEKVKDFTKDIAEVVKNVGEIASPLLPVYKLLSGLF